MQLLTNGYNKQVHRATRTSPFHVIILSETPVAATFDTLSGPAKYMQGDVAPRHMPNCLPQRIELIKTALWSQLSTAARRYKLNLDKKERREPILKVGKYVFIDRPNYPLMHQMVVMRGQGSDVTSYYAERRERTEHPRSIHIQ